MGAVETHSRLRFRLNPFKPIHAQTIAAWTRTAEELFWLAPSTLPPLTPAKVLAWQKPGGHSFVGLIDGDPRPLAFAELNPMRHRVGHLWLGHCVVRPDLRGCGFGKHFVRELLVEAFDRMDACRVSLIVFPDNHGAVRCYKQCHFRLAGEELHRFAADSTPSRLLRLEALPSALRRSMETSVPSLP